MKSKTDKKLSRFEKIRENDRLWVIPSLDVRLPHPYEIVYRELVRYWTIELTLTSGDVQTFYVKAKDQHEAIKIAQGYSYLTVVPSLRTDDFVLKPSTQKIDHDD